MADCRARSITMSVGCRRFCIISDIRYLKADQKYFLMRHVIGEVIIDEMLDEFPDLFSRVNQPYHWPWKDVQGRIGVRMYDVD